jgi:hypothetical protein
VLLSSVLFPIPSAQAAWLQYQSSPADTFNSPDILPEYDITGINIAVSDTAPDEYMFFVQFTKGVTPTLFADGLGSWAGVFLDTNDDGKIDYSLETDGGTYSGNYSKTAKFVDRTTGSPINSSRCTTQTWTNIATAANWIGFNLKKNCLSMSSTIRLQAYSDHISSDNGQFDYAPESMWRVSLDGGSISSTGNSSSTVTAGQLPSMNNQGASTISSPSNPPEDLVSLAAETTKSVVTVLCGSGIGSGWSINATLSSANTSDGFKSYVITNHHVIADCVGNRNIYLLLSNQTKVPAYVYSWDEANDVAGILTSTVIPPLNWRGVTPQQGWWVAAIGSPLGFPGILTTGIVSSVNAQTNLGTTNAAINPGNSGGPVFDRTGRVIGLATAKYVNSEGFGIFHGTPLLCQKIVVCQGTNQVWSGTVAPSNSSNPKPTASPTPSPTNIYNRNKKTQYINLSREVSDTSVSAKYISVRATADSGLPVTSLSDDLSVCDYENGRIVLYSTGSCTIYFNQDGNDYWNTASPTVVRFEVLAPSSNKSITAKITQTSHTWAGFITSYEWISGSNPLMSNKLTTLRISGMCTGSGKTIQGWKNTDAKGKRYPNGSRPTGAAWKCIDGAFEGNVQISGGTRFYIVELPKSRNGTTIEFRVNQELDFIEYID